MAIKTSRITKFIKMTLQISIFGILFMPLVACSGNNGKKGWSDIDYSKVKNRTARENDGNYTQPSVIACVDDDLYNCR